MKQTAIEWLVEQLDNTTIFSKYVFLEIIEQAKEMEKEQIMDAWITTADYHSAEQYYNETFKSE